MGGCAYNDGTGAFVTLLLAALRQAIVGKVGRSLRLWIVFCLGRQRTVSNRFLLYPMRQHVVV